MGLCHESNSLLRPLLALGAPALHALELRVRALRRDRRVHDHVAAVGMRDRWRPRLLHRLPVVLEGGIVHPLLECGCFRPCVVGQHWPVFLVGDLVGPAVRRHEAHSALQCHLNLWLLVLILLKVRVPPLEVKR